MDAASLVKVMGADHKPSSLVAEERELKHQARRPHELKQGDKSFNDCEDTLITPSIWRSMNRRRLQRRMSTTVSQQWGA